MGDFEEALAAAMAELNVGPRVRQDLITNDLTRVADFTDLSENDLHEQGGLTKIAAKKLLTKVVPRARELAAAAPGAGGGGEQAAPPLPPRPGSQYTTLHRPAASDELYEPCVRADSAESPSRRTAATRPLPSVPAPAAASADVIYDEPLPAAFVVTGCEVPEWNGSYYHVPKAETASVIPKQQERSIGEVYRHESAGGAVCYVVDDFYGTPGSPPWIVGEVTTWVLHVPGHVDPVRDRGFVRGLSSCRGGEAFFPKYSPLNHWDLRPLPPTDEWFNDSHLSDSYDQPSTLRIEISEAYLAAKGFDRDVIEYGEERRAIDTELQQRNVSKMYKALYKYEPQGPQEVPLAAGSLVKVLERIDDDWWKVVCNGRTGMAPQAYLKEA